MVSFLKMQGLRHIFVATNDVKWVRKAVGKSVSFTPKKFVKTLDAQLLSTVEQDICEHAEIFIGSRAELVPPPPREPRFRLQNMNID